MFNKKFLQLLGLMLIMTFVPIVTFADMSTSYIGNTSENSVLVTMEDRAMVISYGLTIDDSMLLAKLEDMYIQQIELWIIKSANTNTINAIRNVSTAINVQHVLITQSKESLPDYQVLVGLLNEKDIQTDSAVSGEQYHIESANIFIETVSIADFAVRAEYGNVSFDFLSSINVLNDPSRDSLKRADVWYIDDAVNSNTAINSKTYPTFAVIDSGDITDETNASISSRLYEAGVSVLITGKNDFSLTSDGILMHLANTKSYGVVNKTKVNVRESPSIDADRIANLKKNSTVTITGTTTVDSDGVRWYEIDLNGKTGFVRGDLISPITSQQMQQLSSQKGKTKTEKTPKPTVDTTSGSTKKGH